jgi:hypothetical protein
MILVISDELDMIILVQPVCVGRRSRFVGCGCGGGTGEKQPLVL